SPCPSEHARGDRFPSRLQESLGPGSAWALRIRAARAGYKATESTRVLRTTWNWSFMTRSDSQRRCRAKKQLVRATGAQTERRSGSSERIRLVAKLDVRRSGPETARDAYRWQSAWENPMKSSYHALWCNNSCVLQ